MTARSSDQGPAGHCATLEGKGKVRLWGGTGYHPADPGHRGRHRTQPGQVALTSNHGSIELAAPREETYHAQGCDEPRNTIWYSNKAFVIMVKSR